MNFYKTHYIKLYFFTLKTPSAEESPEQIASMVLTLLVSFNVAIVMLTLEEFGIKWASLFFESKIPMVVVFVSTAIFNYFTFIRKRKYMMMIKEYDLKEESKRKLHTLLCITHFILTAVVFMILV